MPAEDDAPTIGEHQFEVSLRSIGPGTKVFGHIRLERELGRGGMGVVWLAHDELIDLPIALKFLPDVVARDAEATNELKRELKRGLSLTHPGIVRVYRFEQDDVGAAIAMEYVDGPTLSSLKAKQVGGCFDVKDIEGWIEQCCVALDYAHHEARIVHRDLKPRNLMLTSKGKLKIADFGVATSISDTVSRVSVNKSSGTPPYMSPQQAFGGDPSPSDDVYSLGATIYELLTGRPPFYQGNILAQVQQRVPPKMRERRAIFKVVDKAEIPEVWEATVAACLAKHPEDRPQSALQVLECLRGQRTPAVAEHAVTQIDPLNELPISDLDSTKTSVGIPPEEYATTSKVDLPPPPVRPPEPDDRTHRVVPLSSPPQKSKALLWMVLLALIGFGIGAWLWQKDADRRATEQLHTLGSIASMPEASAPITSAIGANGHIAAPDAERDAKLAAEGKIPAPDHPWENTLEMKFVPVPGTAVLFSIFETRIQDYKAFAEDTRIAEDWKENHFPSFEQNPAHPVVRISYTNAVDFCAWLTRTERASGHLGVRQHYRLPTDEEWSTAVGLPKENGATPAARNEKIPGIFPWGTAWPPPAGAGNYMSEGDNDINIQTIEVIRDYKDGFSHTAPVGSFQANTDGIYDLGGNAWEWVEDWYDESKAMRTLRGASWMFDTDFKNDLLSSHRKAAPPGDDFDYFGFRAVIDLNSTQ